MSIIDQPVILISSILGGYLLGSIPFGFLLTSILGLGDIRKIGSGNIGATNVLRTGNKSIAFLTLILDGGKGGIAVLLVYLFEINPIFSLIAGSCSVIGHNFPVWLKFKGGKGVATTIGTLLAVSWPVGLSVCAIWLAVILITRLSSLSAIISLGLSPVCAWYFLDQPDNQPLIIMATFLGVLAVVRHHANIGRIIRGVEVKIGTNKS